MYPKERISTGIPGLDEVLKGGVIPNHSYLLVGAAGTGKTICSIQWLLDGYEKGEKGLYVTLAEPVENIVRNVAGFGWTLDNLDVVDLNPISEQPEGEVDEYSIFSPGEVERASMWDGVYRAVRDLKPKRVVIDSVTQLRYLSTDDYQFRKQILALVNFLLRSGCTSILTFEPSELEREVSVALAVDGILRLRMEVSPNRVVGLRSVQVEKMRGSDFMSGLHPMRFTPDGVVIFPHRVEAPGDGKPGQAILSSGLPDLDALLGGGLESGTTTVLSGPSGTGKTTLGVQFLVRAVEKGERAVLFSFEESPVSIIERCETIGIRVKEKIDADELEIIRVNPMELYPDEFLQMLRDVVLGGDRRVVMIDSLRGYELAMEEYGSPVAHIYNLVTFLNREGITTLMTNEIEEITGSMVATGLGVSYAVDNIVLLRYAEFRNRVIKVVACLKKRHGFFEPALHEFRITPDGIWVGDELRGMRGILSGAPVLEAGYGDGVDGRQTA